uniref:Uncharacterized protein n=1 Tax=Rhizophora mucronata TaxID=61149 RepID=A0A2P2PEI8_RHIMU
MLTLSRSNNNLWHRFEESGHCHI